MAYLDEGGKVTKNKRLQLSHFNPSIKFIMLGPLLAVESRDLSQGDKSTLRVSFFQFYFVKRSQYISIKTPVHKQSLKWGCGSKQDVLQLTTLLYIFNF